MYLFDDRMVMVETYSAELTVVQPRELALYAKAFALLHRSAVYGNPTRALVAKALAEMKARQRELVQQTKEDRSHFGLLDDAEISGRAT